MSIEYGNLNLSIYSIDTNNIMTNGSAFLFKYLYKSSKIIQAKNKPVKNHNAPETGNGGSLFIQNKFLKYFAKK